MSDQFLGEIRIFGCNFAPVQWTTCSGQIMSISQNTALFSLLGTNYGGNGTTTFGLPNLMGTFPMFWGQGPGLSQHVQGEFAGTETVTLLTNELPAHNHTVTASPLDGALQSSLSGVPSRSPSRPYGTTANSVAATSLASVGQGLPHNNMPPYLALNFCIALAGIYPSRP